jgi:hypothetical protein
VSEYAVSEPPRGADACTPPCTEEDASQDDGR